MRSVLLHPDCIEGNCIELIQLTQRSLKWSPEESVTASRLYRGQIATCYRFDLWVSRAGCKQARRSLIGFTLLLDCFSTIELFSIFIFPSRWRPFNFEIDLHNIYMYFEIDLLHCIGIGYDTATTPQNGKVSPPYKAPFKWAMPN